MTMTKLGRAAVLALMFAVPLTTAAYADEHGPDRRVLLQEKRASDTGQNVVVLKAGGKPSNVTVDFARANHGHQGS